VFQRLDLEPVVIIKADPYAVGDTRLSSCSSGPVPGPNRRAPDVGAAGLGIDNIYVDLTAGEVRSWTAPPLRCVPAAVSWDRRTGRRQKFICIKKPVELKQGDKWVRFEPYDGFRYLRMISKSTFPARFVDCEHTFLI